ncbi:MAG: TVP38/TMEM64 family protein [Chloroflexi bacterium]|nr:TVP38/TMEM64 family protein [Chloroflexota bacterium]
MQTFWQKFDRLFLLPSSPIGRSSAKPLAANSFFRRFGFLIILLALLAGVLLWQIRESVWTLLSLVGDQEAVSAYLRSYGAWGPLILAVAQLVQVFVVVIPGHVFLIAAGYVYGFVPGLVLNLVYIVVASQLAFALARWAGRPLVEHLVDKKTLDRWYRVGEKQGFLFFTIAFVMPVFPTDAMNFVGGLSGISGMKFLAANILGRLPSAIMLTMIGAYGLEFGPKTWFTIGGLAVVVLIIGRIIVARIEARHM